MIEEYVERIDELQETIIKDSEKMLKSIDLDELMINPREYLLSIGIGFLSRHLDEIEKGKEEGKRFARKTIGG